MGFRCAIYTRDVCRNSLLLFRCTPNSTTSSHCPNAARLYLNRYTNAGDTVLGIGVDITSVAMDAIGRGRRVEFYLLDASKRGALLTNISGAFHKAHSSGMFQVGAGGNLSG